MSEPAGEKEVSVSKRHFLVSAVILAFSFALLALFPWQQKFQDFPNVVFIILDAARADHFSCYGYEKDTTPRIDGISRKGALFLNNFSPATSTRESLPKIFFSRYFSLGIFQEAGRVPGPRREAPWTVFRKFDGQQIFLTDILSSNGYRTALFHDHARFTRESYLGRKFDEVYYYSATRKHTPNNEIVPAATSWIAKNKDRKFFIYCHIMSPHSPYPPKKEDDEFLPGVAPPTVEAVREKFYARKNELSEHWNRNDLRILRGLYDSNLKHSDKWIGILHDKLKELGLEEKTLVIVTSDHAEHLGEHNRLDHADPPSDSVTHIPLIMAYPPLIPPGVRITGLTESIDIMPTILDICGIEIPENKSMDGVSLLEFIRNPKTGKESVFTNDSIRTTKYRYIFSQDALYDLKEDPGEMKNVAEQLPLVKGRLKTAFEQAMRPYRERFENSKRENPPDFPFHFPIDVFKIVPEDTFEKCEDWRDNIVVLEEASPTKSWLLNTHWHSHGLFSLPANGPPPPILLSANLPNGSYRASILLESPDKISLSPEKLGFRFRFDTRKSFVLPGKTDPVRKYGKDFCCYLDLGKIRVRKEKFSVQISFDPPDSGPYVIRHIKFVPARSAEKETVKGPDKEEFRRRMEGLESLGYLR